MSPRLPIAVATLVIVLALFALNQVSAPVSSLAPPPYSAPETNGQAKTPPFFIDAALEWNLFAPHQQSSKQLTALTDTLGAGACVIDINRDGWLDLFILGGSGQTRHYGKRSWWNMEAGDRMMINVNGEYFRDASASAGLVPPHSGMACNVADLDADGWQDLIVTSVKKVTLYRNTGNDSFEDMTLQSGVEFEGWTTTASIADFDRDGLPDIYFGNYIAFQKGAPTFERNKGFVADDVSFEAGLYDPQPNRLYRNLGDYRFEDVTARAGVEDDRGRTLGALWADFNKDQWPDLLVINDTDSPNQVYLNSRDGNFERGSARYALLEAPDSRDARYGDLDGNGRSDVLVTRAAGATPLLVELSDDADLELKDHAWETGIASLTRIYRNAWGAAIGDFNNDGHSDIYIGNGGSNPDIDSPFVPQGQRDTLLYGDPAGHMVEHSTQLNTLAPLSSRSVIAADLDNDGRLELLITHNNDPLRVLRQEAAHENHWIGLDFSRNPVAMTQGTTIELIVDDKRVARTLGQQQSFLSSGDYRIHIGLGARSSKAKLEIALADGTRSVINDLLLDRYHAVEIASGTAKAMSSPGSHDTDFLLAIEDYSDAARISLGRLLLAIDSPSGLRELTLLWRASSISVRLALLTDLDVQATELGLLLVKLATQSNVEAVQLQAIAILKELEFEYSVPWLTHLLAGQSDNTSCAAAATLQFFFEEEEAVTHRKHISVPDLVRLLDSGNARRATCAANALAAAETKRGTLPLITLMESPGDSAARAAAARALGLIRDTRAIPPLTDIVSMPQAHDPALVAASLVALERLAYEDARSALSRALEQTKTGANGSSWLAFAIANTLLEQPEGIVFGQAYLQQAVSELLAAERIHSKKTWKNTQQAIEILRAIRLSGNKQYLSSVSALANHSDQRVRAAAYRTALTIASDAQQSFYRQLTQEDPPLIADAFDYGDDYNLTPNDPEAHALAQRIANNGLLLGRLVQIYAAHSAAGQQTLMRHLTRSGIHLAELLNLCPSLDTGQPINKLNNAHPAALYMEIYCRHHQPVSTDKSATISLSERLAIKSLSESPKIPAAARRHLLIEIARSDPVTAETLLILRMNGYPLDDYLAAIRALAAHAERVETRQVLEALLADNKRPTSARLEAARLLLPFDRGGIITFINQELGLHAID